MVVSVFDNTILFQNDLFILNEMAIKLKNRKHASFSKKQNMFDLRLISNEKLQENYRKTFKIKKKKNS